MSGASLYKFLHKRDVPLLMEQHTLKICASDHYAAEYGRMEIKDPKINDPNEGVAVWAQRSGGGGEAAALFMSNLIGPLGLGPVSPNSPLAYGVGCEGNVIVQEFPQFHMLCFTHGDPLEQISRFNDLLALDGTTSPYDACLEVSDPKALVRAIMDTGVIVRPEPSGVPFCGVFENACLDEVSYEALETNWTEFPRPPGPFRKDIGFKDQKEVRIVFDSSFTDDGATLVPVFIVKVPSLDRHLREVPLV